jgi:hypothetical protein
MATTHRQDTEFRDQLIKTTLLEEAIDWIGSNLAPEDVFRESDLVDWAESNGYVKEQD